MAYTASRSIPERRQCERFETPSLRATCGGAPLDVLNLSLRGLSFETESRLSPGAVVRFKITGERDELDGRGRVIWCQMIGSVATGDGTVRPRYRGGVRFEELSDQSRSAVTQLVESLWKSAR